MKGLEESPIGAMPQRPERPVRLKEYPPDFGNESLQDMIDDFIVRRFDGIRQVIPVSRFDDQRTHIDRVMDGDVRFAADYTGTQSPKEMQSKMRELVANPLVQLHDNEGKVIDPEEMLKVILPVNAIEWGGAYNDFLKKQEGTPVDYLPDPERESLNIAEHIVRQIDTLPAALKLTRKPDAEIERVIEYAKPIRAYFSEEINRLKKKPRSGSR